MMSSSCDTSSSAKLASDTLLVIGYVWPEPCSSAAGSRMLQLIRAFQQAGYQVVYASPAEYSDHAADLAALHIRRGDSGCQLLQLTNNGLIALDPTKAQISESHNRRLHCCSMVDVRTIDVFI